MIATPIAVVGSREDGDDIAVVAPVVALHDELVGPRHEREAVGVVEGLADVLPKGVPGTPRGNAPATTVIGVRPQQVTHGALQTIAWQ